MGQNCRKNNWEEYLRSWIAYFIHTGLGICFFWRGDLRMRCMSCTNAASNNCIVHCGANTIAEEVTLSKLEFNKKNERIGGNLLMAIC